MTKYTNFNITRTAHHVLHYTLICQLPSTALCSSFRQQFLFLRVSVFINTIWRELQSSYSSCTTHQMFMRTFSCLL